MINLSKKASVRSQRGVAAVEFALVAALLFILLFGILEFGRMFYMFNTVQEVTRRAAREAVVRWVDNSSTSPAKRLSLFGGTVMPAGAEITVDNIDIEYLGTDGVEIASGSLPPGPSENISACLDPSGAYDCIAYVRVSITNVTYVPMVGLFSGVRLTAFPFSEANPFVIDLSVPIPASTVTMPAESMGYSG
jgi:Flp pilus assembly pilin Flp